MVVDQDITTFFNKVYDDTYKKVFGYVTSKCSSTNDISDILQEVYIELYSVIMKKGQSYISNYEAFVLRIAKTKVFRHYSVKEKMKCFIPMFSKGENDEVNIIDFELAENMWLETKMINNLLVEDITRYILKKSEITKKVFYLFYYCEYTIPQISKELCIKESNVKNRLYRTVKELREIYGKDGA